MFNKIAMKLGLRWLGARAREIAEGKKGPTLQKMYIGMIGRKRLWGAILALASVALVAVDKADAAMLITGPIALGLLSIGAIDANWRSIPKLDSPWYTFCRNHAADIAALLAAAAASASQCGPELAAKIPFGITCGQLTAALTALSAMFAHVFLSAEALASKPPAIGLGDER